jgi:putative chitinase
VARELGNTQPGDGALFHGRGYVQLTGRRNYARASDVVQHDLLADPDAAMRADFATAIMFTGMRDGWFTRVRLADYFSRTKDDPVNARRIINGTDKAQQIAGYHRDFLMALGNG